MSPKHPSSQKDFFGPKLIDCSWAAGTCIFCQNKQYIAKPKYFPANQSKLIFATAALNKLPQGQSNAQYLKCFCWIYPTNICDYIGLSHSN